MTTAYAKSVMIPRPGMYFTNGAALVEILAKSREGYRACNVLVPVEHALDVDLITLSASDVNGGPWRLVTPDVT